jgi:lysophospholipase L1-like esterase
MSATIGVLTIEKLVDGKASPPLYLYSLTNSIQGSVAIACAITSPLPGDLVTPGIPVTITGTITTAATVVVKLGSTTLGSATVVGLNWSYSWTPQAGDVGARLVNAVATNNIDSSVASAPGVAITVNVVPITCAITSPTAGGTVYPDIVTTITGTVNVAGTVVVKEGSTVLGSATMNGLNWSFSWTPALADAGAQTLNATATATVGGSTANATGVAVTVATPLNLAGNASVGGWLTVYAGITLGTTLLKTGGGGAVTIAGTSGAGLAQSSAVRGIIMATGALGASTIAWSVDGGLTFQPTIPTAATMDLGNGITATLPAATYTFGTLYEATVAQWVDQKNGYVFAQATVTKQPALRRTAAGLEVVPDGVDDLLVSSTAGVATSFAVNAAPFSLFVAGRAGKTTLATAAIFSVGQTAAATKLINFYTNTSALELFTGGAALSSTGVVVAGARQTLELWQTGAAASLIANGVTLFSGVAQVTQSDSTLNEVSLFASNLNSVAAIWGDNSVSEIVWYTGNQHATTSTPITAYLNARWAEVASVALPDAKFFDAVSAQTVAGAQPLTWAPNDYRVWLPDRIISGLGVGTQVAAYRRLVVTVPAGVTSLIVSAVPSNNTAVNEGLNTVAAYVDGGAGTVLLFTGPLGLKQTATLTLDGSAHTVELDERASIVGVVGVGGTVTVTSATTPTKRVLFYGDSIVFGYKASDQTKGWAVQVRHALEALGTGYDSTIWGIPSKAGAADCSTSPQVTASVGVLTAALDGSVKNILVDAMGTNDYGAGSTAANYAIWKGNQYDALHTAVPGAKILIFSPIPRAIETANAGGSTLGDFRTALAGVQAARSSYITYLDGPSVIPTANTTYLNADLLHPNDFGYATIKTALLTAIQAL